MTALSAPAIVEAAALIVLAAITAWYAYSSHQILKESRRQAAAATAALERMEHQSEIMTMAALLTGHSALTTAGGSQGWQPIRKILEELEELRKV